MAIRVPIMAIRVPIMAIRVPIMAIRVYQSSGQVRACVTAAVARTHTRADAPERKR